MAMDYDTYRSEGVKAEPRWNGRDRDDERGGNVDSYRRKSHCTAQGPSICFTSQSAPITSDSSASLMAENSGAKLCVYLGL